MLRKCLLRINLKNTLLLPLTGNVCNHYSLPAPHIDPFLIFSGKKVTYRYCTRDSAKYSFTRGYARKEKNSVSSKEQIIKSFSKGNGVVGTLQEILNCGIKEAQRCYHYNVHLFNNEDAIEEIIEKCKYCERVGISKKFILSNPWIFQLSDVEIERKIGLLKKWKFKNLSSNFSLLKITTNKLSEFTQKTLIESTRYPSLLDSNRITYLAELLKKEEEDISELCIKHEYILRMKFTKLESTLNILIKRGLDPKYIFTDIWVVRYSLKDICGRLKMLESLEPHELRSWMFHCGNQSFQRSIKLRDENRNAREPFATDEDYLCHRLNITLENVQQLYQRHPPLRCVQTTKLKDILDYLFAQGFKSADICRVPRILCHSLLTIKDRMENMKSLGYRPQNLHVCCQTKKKFKLFINKLHAKHRAYSAMKE